MGEINADKPDNSFRLGPLLATFRQIDKAYSTDSLNESLLKVINSQWSSALALSLAGKMWEALETEYPGQEWWQPTGHTLRQVQQQMQNYTAPQEEIPGTAGLTPGERARPERVAEKPKFTGRVRGGKGNKNIPQEQRSQDEA